MVLGIKKKLAEDASGEQARCTCIEAITVGQRRQIKTDANI